MLGELILIIAGISASLAQNSSTGTEHFSISTATSQILFAQCPDSYTNYCYHGTCRFLLSEWEASCILCRIKRERSRLTLLTNTDVNDV
ncbi:protransforming growth factor alpha-like isoform X3 [Mixophyes fleayi]|uniref:protransforming growth factor alpha-like isoform X3 n=1 Tax=Mixophyes fleayi TaxID=3061075 RepID=UPI003F4E4144